VKTALSRFGHVLLTLDKDLDHFTNFLQSGKDNLVALDKAVALVLDGGLVAEFSDKNLQLAQIVAGHTREHVVAGLELKASVEKVQPSRAFDIHGGAELALGEALGWAKVGGRHTPVAEGDLDVQKHGDAVGNEDKSNSDGPGGESAPQKSVAKDGPVASHEGNLNRAGPPSRAKVGGTGGHEVEPGEEVEVEASNGHDGVVRVLLVGDEEVGGGIPDKGKVVKGAQDGAEVGGRGGEEGHVLEIGVMLGHVCDEMVNVVRALPPSDAQTTAKVGDEGTNQRVGDEVAGDAAVAGVVSGEHDLLPEHAQEAGRAEVPLGAEKVEEGAEQNRVADQLFAVLDVRAVVEALVLDTLVQSAEVQGNGVLSLLVDRGVGGEALGNLLLLHGRRKGHAGGVLGLELIGLVTGRQVCLFIQNHLAVMRLFVVERVVVGANGRAADGRLEVGPGLGYPAHPVCFHALQRL
jgi:hypothetical protein